MTPPIYRFEIEPRYAGGTQRIIAYEILGALGATESLGEYGILRHCSPTLEAVAATITDIMDQLEKDKVA